MTEGTLTTLDFVISVLREHEKEMTQLSDKLEEVLNSASTDNLEKFMNEINAALKDIKQRLKASNQNTTDSNISSIENFLVKLVEQVTIQNQSLSLLLETMSKYPTKNELETLKTSISSFNSLIQSIESKGDSKGSPY